MHGTDPSTSGGMIMIIVLYPITKLAMAITAADADDDDDDTPPQWSRLGDGKVQ